MSAAGNEPVDDADRVIHFKTIGGEIGEEKYILYELEEGEAETNAWMTSAAAIDVGRWR